MTRRRLPLVSLPKLMVPLISARIDGSFGRRASNRSATRGRPPVMSRVFEVSCGIRATTSPTFTLAPSDRLTRVLAGRKYWAGTSVPGSSSSLPLASTSLTAGRMSLPAAGRSCRSITSMLVRPVSSSVWRRTVMPSSMPTKVTVPAISVTIGWVCGSHLATMAPASTLSPSLMEITAP
ncbi:hypothetical protein D3C86_1541260 [compost metagenome]